MVVMVMTVTMIVVAVIIKRGGVRMIVVTMSVPVIMIVPTTPRQVMVEERNRASDQKADQRQKDNRLKHGRLNPSSC